jgi:hypothetical protein
VTPCRLVQVYRRFVGMQCLQLYCQRVIEANDHNLWGFNEPLKMDWYVKSLLQPRIPQLELSLQWRRPQFYNFVIFITYSYTTIPRFLWINNHLKSSIFLDKMPYSPFKINGRFGETFLLYLQSRRICPARNQLAAGIKKETCFFRNVGWFSTDNMALCARR